jgi:hypothetical protein
MGQKIFQKGQNFFEYNFFFQSVAFFCLAFWSQMPRFALFLLFLLFTFYPVSGGGRTWEFGNPARDSKGRDFGTEIPENPGRDPGPAGHCLIINHKAFNCIDIHKTIYNNIISICAVTVYQFSILKTSNFIILNSPINKNQI